LPTGTLIGDLFQNEELVSLLTIGSRYSNKFALVYLLLTKRGSRDRRIDRTERTQR
jgi:hypothetical protein